MMLLPNTPEKRIAKALFLCPCFYLLSVEDARTRAEATVTKKGLTIIATINQRMYETKRPVEKSYESNKSKRIIFDDELPKWNYLVKCCS